DLCFIAVGEAGAERGAEVETAVALVTDHELGPRLEVFVIAARAKQVAHLAVAHNHAVNYLPRAVFLVSLAAVRDLPAIKVFAVEDGYPAVFVLGVGLGSDAKTREQSEERARHE